MNVTDPSIPEQESPKEEAPPAHAGALDLLENAVFVQGDSIDETLALRLRTALAGAVDKALALITVATLEPLPVRASEPISSAAATLALPEQARSLLGTRLETHVLLGEEQTRVWLAGTDLIASGTELTVVAIGADGTDAAASATVTDPSSPLELVLPCRSPKALMLAVGSPADR